ncbi:MAG: hypothetical protein EOO74_09235 [Myxococcales bacterium]|nr:MAG: hypothetical protein EOO74_09235 [Myxococcales bacterium]
MSAYDLFRFAEGQFAERDYLGAAQALERLIAEHTDEPDLNSARELLTRSYFHSAQLRKAEAAARDLLDRDPTHAYAALLLARALERQSRPEEADAARRLADALGAPA